MLLGLESLRPKFLELEHFSLLLRELHDEGALALVLHVRNVVERLTGLRMKDVKERFVFLTSRIEISFPSNGLPGS